MPFYGGFTHVKDSIFHQILPPMNSPAPKDPRLRSLLTLAGSPSIRKTAINPSMKDLFAQVLRNIDIYMGLPTILPSHRIPSLEDGPGPELELLDSNRYAVLKLLYTMLFSDDFGTTHDVT